MARFRKVLSRLGTGDLAVGAGKIASRWRDRVAVDGLLPAVVVAYEEAGRRRLETWADAISRVPELASDADYPVVDEPSAASSVPGSGPNDQSVAEYARTVWHVLTDVSERLDDLAAEAQDHAQRAVTGNDSGRHVTVTLTGAGLTGVHADARWLEQTPPDEIGRAVMDAVRAAYATVEELAASSMTRRWPFDDLDRLTADPSQLFAGLGLPVPSTFCGKG